MRTALHHGPSTKGTTMDNHHNDQAQRRAAVESVRGSLAAEGLETSTAYDDDAERYVSGSLTADELVARAEQRYRRQAEPGAE
ncbi:MULTISPECIES: antitoxin VbhA family protein [Streptacidiphilus]|uniref:Antitoxin VbhA family protein n=1 Tax=Streptacidiphilus cavernicola TaxID=3342716 RepID=A0ABV6V0B5_9ACTN|nr:antitoxin VbhA family protein [Streptacidiphilus jeojiense]